MIVANLYGGKVYGGNQTLCLSQKFVANVYGGGVYGGNQTLCLSQMFMAVNKVRPP